MFEALKSGFRSLATLKLVVNVVGELQTENNSCGIARFPCDSTTFLFLQAFSRRLMNLYNIDVHDMSQYNSISQTV